MFWKKNKSIYLSRFLENAEKKPANSGIAAEHQALLCSILINEDIEN